MIISTYRVISQYIDYLDRYCPPPFFHSHAQSAFPLQSFFLWSECMAPPSG